MPTSTRTEGLPNSNGAEARATSDAAPPPKRAKRAEKELRARLRRRERLQRAADAGVERWRDRHGQPRAGRNGEPLSGNGSEPPLLTPLPRPQGLGAPDVRRSALPPRRASVDFKAGFFRSLRRLVLWLYGASRFLLGVLWDKLRRRDSEARRAWRLRMTFERMGTTFIKLGQQLSMRLDLLPYAYTRELEKMLDSVPPFPVEEAVRVIEHAAGRPLGEVFSAFDPNPIGSASVACVYQAVLRNGERVAVKVRRPGIGELLSADMRALNWLFQLAELTVLRPDFTANFMVELRMMLMEELDFIREARFTDSFRRGLRKTKQLRYASAPRVHFDLSRADVLVTEFVSGIRLTEILTALETKDEQLQARLRGMNIDPVILARRFLLISRFGNFEHIFFHADLHPANILVQPGNKIFLIDFGSCGSFTKRELIVWRRVFEAQSLNDVGAMVQAALAIIEPLPPVDRDEFALRLEAMFWNDLYAIKSKHSEWWERISARLWIGFLKVAREYGIPMRLNMLRMIRAIMLADTIAARLDHDLDPYREYRFYEKGAGKRAEKRLDKKVRRMMKPSKYIRLEQGFESALNLLYQVQRVLNSVASIRLLPLIGKAALGVYLVGRTAVIIGVCATLFALALLFTSHPDETFLHILWFRVLGNGYFQLFGLFLCAFGARRLYYRLWDPDDYRR